MDLLSFLPADLFSGLLKVWLPFVAIGRIDSAYCCAQRGDLLATFGAIVFSAHGVDRWYPASMVKWLLKRQVCVSVFKYKIRESGPVSAYLKCCGIHITSIVQYQNHGTQTDKTMQIGHMCPNLVKFNGTWNMLGGTWYLLNLQELVLRTHYSYTIDDHQAWIALTSTVIDNYVARAPWPHLKRLSVTGILTNTVAVVQRMVLAAAQPLQCLILRSGDINYPLPHQLIETLTHCHQLRSLGLRGVDDTALHTISSQCPHICHLDLSHNPTITDTGILRIARGLSALRSLCLCRCDNLTNVALEDLHTYRTNTLQVLFLDNLLMHGVSAPLVHTMFPKLRTYHFVRECCTMGREYGVADVLIVNQGIQYLGLANVRAPELEVLVIASDPNHTNSTSILDGLIAETLATLAHRCPKLHTIYVSTSQQCRSVSNFAQGLPQLTVTTENRNHVYDLLIMPV